MCISALTVTNVGSFVFGGWVGEAEGNKAEEGDYGYLMNFRT